MISRFEMRVTMPNKNGRPRVFTKALRREIQRAWFSREATQQQLAAQFKVSQSTIHRAVIL